jgi:hypothetical protein
MHHRNARWSLEGDLCTSNFTASTQTIRAHNPDVTQMRFGSGEADSYATIFRPRIKYIPNVGFETKYRHRGTFPWCMEHALMPATLSCKCVSSPGYNRSRQQQVLGSDAVRRYTLDAEFSQGSRFFFRAYLGKWQNLRPQSLCPHLTIEAMMA